MHLEVQNLTKSYDSKIKALDNVSLNLKPGLFGLLGPNGAGKSTLMRTIATLQLPDSGSVNLKFQPTETDQPTELDLVKQYRQTRKILGYLPQEMGVYPRVTAKELLDYLAGLKGMADRKNRNSEVLRKLEQVHLLKEANQRLDTFSGGMKQRFGIAAALIGNPKLLIVDEPTAGLDPSERRHFQLMLTEAAKDCIVILSSHIVEDIAGLCSEMALIDRGKIVLTGNPSQLTQQINGNVWEVRIPIHSFQQLKSSHQVLSWRPIQNEVVTRFYSEVEPSKVYEVEARQVNCDLEDLYAYHVAPEKD